MRLIAEGSKIEEFGEGKRGSKEGSKGKQKEVES